MFLRKNEILGILIILFFILLANFISFKISQRNARDVQRNLDLGAVRQGLELYFQDYRYYPLSSADGKIVACKGEETKVLRDNRGFPVREKNAKKPKLVNLKECQWGKDGLFDVQDYNYPSYLSKLPQDPLQEKGFSYRYFSDGTKFQIYGAFEGKTLKEYDKEIARLQIFCGTKVCNFGKASPPDILYQPLLP